MADFYLDQWAYAYTATAQATMSGSVVTLSSVVGRISRGTLIVGAGIPANTYVTTFGTGTGGNGTYNVTTSATVSAPVSVTCTQGCPVAATVLPPVWGVPEDGDGKAQAASTASATVSLDCSTYVFTSGSSTFSVMGCTPLTISGSANSATNAQYSAVLTTMLDNIAAAINLATANIVNRPANWGQVQVRDSVYARRNGTSIELMTRSGSADWNGLVALTWTNVTNGVTGTWSGGVSGCWGWAVAHWAMWPSQWAVGDSGYGVLGRPTQNVLAGYMAPGDRLFIRGGKEIYQSSGSVRVRLGTMWAGTTDLPISVHVDDGTVWTGDPENMVFSVIASAVSSNFNVGVGGAGYNYFYGKQNPNGSKNFSIACVAISANSSSVNEFTSGIRGYAEHVLFSQPNSSFVSVSNNASTGSKELYQCTIEFASSGGYIVTSSSAVGVTILTECTFDGKYLPSAATGLIGAISSNGHEVYFDACRFVNFPSGSKLFANNWQASSNAIHLFTNCDFGNVAYRNTFLSPSSNRALSAFTASTTVYGKKDFFYQCAQGVCDWASDLSYPTLHATLNDADLTKYVMRLTPATLASNIDIVNYLEAPRISKINTLGNNALQVTVNFALDASLAWDRRHVTMQVGYMSGGVLRTETTRTITPTPFTASTETWSSEVSGQVAWYPGPVLHNKYKLELTTSQSVDADTEVAVYFRVHKHVPNNATGLFLDPEVLLAVA